MSKEKTAVEALEEKVKSYEGMLAEALGQARKIGRITAGPVKDPQGDYYRVELEGGTSIVALHNPEIKAFTKVKKKDLKIDADVVVLNGLITSVLPEKLEVEKPKQEYKLTTWDKIGGLKSQIADIREAIENPILHADIAVKLGMEPLKGALLWGPPGCGKTMIAKAVAATILQSDVVDPKAFTYIKGAELLDKYVGATEEKIRYIFQNAREYCKLSGKKAVLFIDEAEAILPRRGSRRSSDVETTIVPSFLAEMDGFDGYNPFVLLATNKPELIDDAILRPGRIDLKIEIKRPTKADVEDIFNIQLKDVKCATPIKTLALEGSEMLAESPAFEEISGAMVETVVKMSTGQALKRLIKDRSCDFGITTADLKEAISKLN